MTWWIWTIVGIMLLIGELITPGILFFLFFAVGCFINALLLYFGVISQLWVCWLVLPSMAMLAFLSLKLNFFSFTGGKGKMDVDSLVGTIPSVISELPPQGEGRVSLRGAEWTAINTSDTRIKVGERVRVVETNGFTLSIEPKKL